MMPLRIPHQNDVRFCFTPICFCKGFILYFCYLYLLTYVGVQHNFHFRLCLCWLAVTRWVSLVQQELLTLQDHMTSLQDVSGVCVAQSLVFCVVFCRSLSLSFFFWPSFFDIQLLILLLWLCILNLFFGLLSCWTKFW